MTTNPRPAAVLLVGVLVVGFVGLAVAAPAAGQSNAGEPELSVFLPDNEVAPGTETTFDLRVQNDANVRSGTGTGTITTARAVSAEVTDEGPFDVRTARTPLGQIPDGTVSSAAFSVTVPEGVDPGTYDVDVRVRYSVTNRETASGDQRLRRSTRETFEVTVTDDALFSIGNVSTDAQPGTTGDAEIELENVGSATAHATTATITGGGGITIDGGSAEAFLGDVEPGDSRTVDVDVAVADSTGGGDKPIEAVFEYRNADGIERAEPRTASGGLASLAAQSFSIETLEDTLSVGYDGRITGTVRNDGPTPVSDGVLVVEPASDSLVIEESRVALPELAPGETADFEFPTDVSGQADPGARQIRFTLEYANGGRTTATVGPTSERVVVDPQRNAFTISGEAIRVTQGGSAELRLDITNERPETLRNVNAKLYADSPLSTTNDETFVNELEPGETGEIRFDLAAAGSAMPNTYRVELDFQYDTERGDTVLSRTYQHPVEITERTDGGDGGLSPLLIGGAVIVAIVLVAAGIRRRRRG